MIAALDIRVTKTERSKLQDIDLGNLPFGKYFTDHMLEADECGDKALPAFAVGTLIGGPALRAGHF